MRKQVLKPSLLATAICWPSLAAMMEFDLFCHQRIFETFGSFEIALFDYRCLIRTFTSKIYICEVFSAFVAQTIEILYTLYDLYGLIVLRSCSSHVTQPAVSCSYQEILCRAVD